MLTTREKQPKKPHAICIPFPAQGHINPMLKLAIILHHKGFHITFVNTEYNHNRLVNSRGKAAVQGSPGFQFATIPDGLPPSENGGDATQDIPTLCHSTSHNCLDPLNELIDTLNDSNTGAPPVSCVVTDGAMSFGLDAAERIGVPGVVLRTASVARFMCHMYFTDLMEKGLVPLKDESYLTNGYLDTPIDWIPGLIPLCLRDFSTFIQVNEKDNMLLNFIVSETKLSSKASAVIANTFDDLEQNVLAALLPMSPPIYTIGPLHLLFEKLIPESNSLKWMSSSLWKEEPACLEWLDTKPKSSVVYVNFGSITVLTAEQLIEFAYGLAESKKNFLWIVRPDLVQGKDASLPVEYWEEVGEKGHVVGWCPQEKVLNHPAIGGFLTHCGWNSTLESLCSGVPMLCWPFFADQQVNCRYLCDEWGVGMAINGNVKRDEVGFLVKELLDGEKGKMMKAKAMEWMEKARKAVSSGGSSNHNLEKLVGEVLNI